MIRRFKILQTLFRLPYIQWNPKSYKNYHVIRMAPSAVQPEESLAVRTSSRKPLKASGALDKLRHFDITPVIGTEFPEANLVELLEAPNSDELLRDLAIKS